MGAFRLSRLSSYSAHCHPTQPLEFMKHSLTIILLLLCSVFGLAQNSSDVRLPIYTLVGAAGDEKIPVYEHPLSSSRVVSSYYPCYYGLCWGTLIANLGDWYQIDGGYVRANEAVLQTWYYGDGEYVIVAAAPKTYIYQDYYDEDDDDGIVITSEYVLPGTILTDRIEEWGDKYYALTTAHDYLYVRKDEVKIVRKEQLRF